MAGREVESIDSDFLKKVLEIQWARREWPHRSQDIRGFHTSGQSSEGQKHWWKIKVRLDSLENKTRKSLKYTSFCIYVV